MASPARPQWIGREWTEWSGLAVPLCPVGPDHGDGDASFSGGCHDVGRTFVAVSAPTSRPTVIVPITWTFHSGHVRSSAEPVPSCLCGLPGFPAGQVFPLHG